MEVLIRDKEILKIKSIHHIGKKRFRDYLSQQNDIQHCLYMLIESIVTILVELLGNSIQTTCFYNDIKNSIQNSNEYSIQW